mgnify:CR=1 FL=1
MNEKRLGYVISGGNTIIREGTERAKQTSPKYFPEGNLFFDWTRNTDDPSWADDLRARRERWDASYFVFQGDTMEPLAPVVAALRGT